MSASVRSASPRARSSLGSCASLQAVSVTDAAMRLASTIATCSDTARTVLAFEQHDCCAAGAGMVALKEVCGGERVASRRRR
jgi:hypothetical protein